jgi:hypothetical protein
MNTLGIGSTKSERKTPAPRQQSTEQPAKKSHGVPPSPCEDLHILIAKRAYDLYGERGYRHGSASMIGSKRSERFSVRSRLSEGLSYLMV